MKTIIIRKPKFMRNDRAMYAYLNVAEDVRKLMCDSRFTYEEKHSLMDRFNEWMDKAAKAGGFLNTDDFCKWMAIKDINLPLHK